MHTLALLFIAFMFSACASEQWRVTPSPYGRGLSNFEASYGNPAPQLDALGSLNWGIPPKNHEKLYKKTVIEMLKDPDSAKIRNILAPKKMWGQNSDLLHYWVICGEVNAKNSFGGYVGFKTMAIRYFPETQEVTPEYLDENGASKFLHAKLRFPCGE